MKSLFLALGIVAAVALVLFGCIHALGVGDKVAAPLASSALGFITFIHDKVDKALSGTRRSPVTPGIVPIAFYRIDSPLMLLYCTLIWMGLIESVSLIGSIPVTFLMLAGVLSNQDTTLAMAVVGVVSTPMLAWCGFALGRWAGVRSERSAYWILPSAMLLGRIIDFAIMFRVLPSSRPMISAIFHDSVSAISAGVVFALLLAIGLLGVWRGNKVRFGAYFNSLLKQVSQPAREALLAMAFDEARIVKAVPPPPVGLAA